MRINKNITSINRTKTNKRSIKYIAVHYTGGTSDTAYNNTVYFKNKSRGASAHYFVDEREIWQCVEDADTAWHCGAKSYRHAKCRNANSIGVEMCKSTEKNEAVEKNTIQLLKYLMRKYSITEECVLRHYDITGKLCPKTLIDENEWKEFKSKLKEDNNMTEAEKSKITAIDESLSNLYRIVEEIKKEKKIYNFIDELPEWAKKDISQLCSDGVLYGDENGQLALTDDMIRMIIIAKRMIDKNKVM